MTWECVTFREWKPHITRDKCPHSLINSPDATLHARSALPGRAHRPQPPLSLQGTGWRFQITAVLARSLSGWGAHVSQSSPARLLRCSSLQTRSMNHSDFLKSFLIWPLE